MTRKLINPDTLYDSLQYGFSHAAKSVGSEIIHCAGQVAWDADCKLVGENDLAAQTRQALKNLGAVLEAAGATPDDVARIRVYVVDHTPDKLGVVIPEIANFFGDLPPPPSTWLGVASLALPDFLIEIEATAVLDRLS